jgi:hypothetical protein
VEIHDGPALHPAGDLDSLILTHLFSMMIDARKQGHNTRPAPDTTASLRLALRGAHSMHRVISGERFSL